jgi:TatD DNase family protein
MIETDAPFLLPRTLRPPPKSRRNEPAFLPAVLEVVARAAGRSPEEVARETTSTSLAFFRMEA